MAKTSEEFLIKLRAIADMKDVDKAAKALRDLMSEFDGVEQASAETAAATKRADKAVEQATETTRRKTKATKEAAQADREAAAAVAKVGENHAVAEPKIRKSAEAKKKAGQAAGEYEGQATKAGQGSKNMGLGVLEASRAFEDLQYGLRGVLNNIPTMIMSFGGGAGLAAGLSFAAVAGDLLFRKLSSGKADMEQAKKAADLLAEANETLAKKITASAEAKGRASIAGYLETLRQETAALESQAAAAERAAASQKRLADLRREAESAQRSKEEAEIAWREANDPRFTAVQAAQARSGLKSREAQAGTEAKVQAEQARVNAAFRAQQAAEERARQAEQQFADMQARYRQLEDQKRKAEAELNRQKQLQANAERFTAKGSETKDAADSLRRSLIRAGTSPSDAASEVEPMLREARELFAKATAMKAQADSINTFALDKEITETKTKMDEMKSEMESSTTAVSDAKTAATEAKKNTEAIASEAQEAVNIIYEMADTAAQARQFEDMTAVKAAAERDMQTAVNGMKTGVTTAVGGITNTSANFQAGLNSIEKALADGLQPADGTPVINAAKRLQGTQEATYLGLQGTLNQIIQVMTAFQNEQRRQQAQLQQMAR